MTTGTPTDLEREYFAFVELTRKLAGRIVGSLNAQHHAEATEEALGLLGQACYRWRQLKGLPEPDPDVDYDPDYHWDGTKRLRGEPRREKGDSYAEGLSLSNLPPPDPSAPPE